jgi:hypothetical protein
MAGINEENKIPLESAGAEPAKTTPNVFTAPWGNMPIHTGWTAMGQPATQQQSVKAAPLNDAGVGKVTPVNESTPAPGGSLVNANFNPKDNKLGVINQPTFKADKTKPDGGALSWLGKVFNENRKPGESEDEYDERVTRNREKLLALGDAIRHMGNVYNTTRYAKSQQFNSPLSQMETELANRKATRQKQRAAEADAAYKAEKLRQQQAAADATANYRAAVLGYKDAADKRAAAKMKTDADHWQQNYDRNIANDKFNQGMAREKFAETKRHNGVTEGQGAARLAIAGAREAREAANGGSGRTGSLTNLATPLGHTNRKKELSSIEKRQLAQWLEQNGYINEPNRKMYEISDNQTRGALVNYWIAYAAQHPGKAGDKFRKHLKDHYGYTETKTTGSASSKITV